MNLLKYLQLKESTFDLIAAKYLSCEEFAAWMKIKLDLGPHPSNEHNWWFMSYYALKNTCIIDIGLRHTEILNELFETNDSKEYYNITYCLKCLANFWFPIANKDICEAMYDEICSWDYLKICKELPLTKNHLSVSEYEFFQYLISMPPGYASTLIGNLSDDENLKWDLRNTLYNKNEDAFVKILFNNRLNYDDVAYHAYFLHLAENLKKVFYNDILQKGNLSKDKLMDVFLRICQLLPDNVKKLSRDLRSIQQYLDMEPDEYLNLPWEQYYKLSLVFLYSPLIFSNLTLRCSYSRDAYDKMNYVQAKYKSHWSKSTYQKIFLEHKIDFDEESWFTEHLGNFYNQFVQEESESEESAPPKNEVEEEEPSKNTEFFSGDKLWTLDEIEKIYLELRKLDYINDSPYTKTTFLYRMVSHSDGRKNLKPKNLIVIRWKGPRRFLLQLIYFCCKGDGRKWKKAKQFFYIEKCPEFDYKGCTKEANPEIPEFKEFKKRIE